MWIYIRDATLFSPRVCDQSDTTVICHCLSSCNPICPAYTGIVIYMCSNRNCTYQSSSHSDLADTQGVFTTGGTPSNRCQVQSLTDVFNGWIPGTHLFVRKSEINGAGYKGIEHCKWRSVSRVPWCTIWICRSTLSPFRFTDKTYVNKHFLCIKIILFLLNWFQTVNIGYNVSQKRRDESYAQINTLFKVVCW